MAKKLLVGKMQVKLTAGLRNSPATLGCVKFSKVQNETLHERQKDFSALIMRIMFNSEL